jgi:hypothetical protein
MIKVGPSLYKTLAEHVLPDSFWLMDHLGGFDSTGFNSVLNTLNNKARLQNKTYDITYHQILDSAATGQCPNLKIKFSPEFQQKMNFLHFKNYNIHPELTFKNFVCCFNGSPHVSRKLLASAIKKFGWWNEDYCSKNFTCSADNIFGHIGDYARDDYAYFYNKFFSVDEDFLNHVYSFGHIRFDHANNIYNLEHRLTKSFLHIVSETMATSYVPFVTEKFLYSIVTRGLFLAYAQPGWHDHLEKYYGFRRYTKLFDYRFDSVQNPVERLVELITMLSKFSVLSTDEWRDLYLLQQDEIEYNYNHYFSQDYLKCLATHS